MSAETCPVFVFLLFSFSIPGIKYPKLFPFDRPSLMQHSITKSPVKKAIFIHTLMSSTWTYTAVKNTMETPLTSPVCSTFHQEEEGGVCPEVLHSQAGCKHPRLPSAQREGAADGARHVPATLHPHPAARRDPHPVEGWNCHSVVRSLKVAPFFRTRAKACLHGGALRLLSVYYGMFSPWVRWQEGNWNKWDKGWKGENHDYDVLCIM